MNSIQFIFGTATYAYLISIFLDVSHSLFSVVNRHFLFQFEIAVIVVDTYYYLRGKGG